MRDHGGQRMRIAFFGSSLVSAYWNGAATYYRGIIAALHARGHHITFYEPAAFDRQKHRDIDDPPYADVVVYDPHDLAEVDRCLAAARRFDLVIKCSGVGVHDELLERRVADLSSPRRTTVLWDVDAPATIARMEANPDDPAHAHVPRYDLVLTYGGGEPIVRAYRAAGAKACVPIYNALDPQTHHPTEPDARFLGHLGFLGNRLPDRERRVRRFFFRAAERLPRARFVLGGSGWSDADVPNNVRPIGHVYTRDHNAFNCTPRAVLNLSRDSMASCGWSPATRVFEAAGAGACLITDAWPGVDDFFTPGEEILVVHDGDELAERLVSLDARTARRIGHAARRRALAEHTYQHRAEVFDRMFSDRAANHGAADSLPAAV